MLEKDILDEVIISYRQVIKERYQYANIHQKYDLPSSFNEERVGLFRNYFLKYLYPPPEKRKELDEAFHNLDNYIKNPEKLLRILLDSASLIFKYGRHLPKILRAGIKALRAFRTANEFENKLVQNALILSLNPPYSAADINTLLSQLSPKDLEQFLENSKSLFETIHDRVLVRKIIEIVEALISKMEKRPKTYTPAEVKGLAIGRDIIKQGDLLFDQLSKSEQQQILNMVLKIERDELEKIFS